MLPRFLVTASPVLLGFCLSCAAQAGAQTPIWTAPLPGARPDCVSAIHVYVRPGDTSPIEYLRAEAIEDRCDAQAPTDSAPADREPAREAREVTGDPHRSAWAWDSEAWRNDPDAFIGSALAQGLDRVFISVPIVAGQVDAAPALERLIRRAHEEGIRISAVEGDPEMITPLDLEYAQTRARALRHYKLSHPEAAIDELQYDIEPYLLAEYAEAPEDMLQGWARSLIALSETYGAQLDIVIPFWLPLAPGGPEALNTVREQTRQLTTMAYRTTPASILAAARPSLLWGEVNDRPVVIALETGPLEDEHLQVYRPSSRGQLQMSRSAPVRRVQLHADTVPGATDAPAFRYSHTVTVPASRVSFGGDLPALFLALEEVEPMLNSYDSYAGVAIHGLQLPPDRQAVSGGL